VNVTVRASGPRAHLNVAYTRIPLKPKHFCGLVLLAFTLFESKTACGTEQMREAKLEDKLAIEVQEFDNQSRPLITTLLKIAADYHLPMGIERVVKEAVEESTSIKLRRGTVADLLDTCVRSIPGYSWSTRDGVVFVYGAEEVNQSSNLFNLVMRSFEVQNETLDRANVSLRMQLIFAKERTGAFAGSIPGSSALEGKRITLSLKNATLRNVLNRLAALHGEAVWIARVPPSRLSDLPQAGLWVMLPRSVEDAKGVLDQLFR
jgi:hypothetical protein